MKIGDLSLKSNVFLAPMAGITNLPFRTLVREFGCSLAFTEMISAAGLVRNTGKSYRYLESSPDDRPLGVQIFGSDKDVLAEAAQIVTAQSADLININMGCPAKKVVRTGAGAALMKDPEQALLILRALRKVTPLPLTVKIRSGWRHDDMKAIEIARIAEDCGVDAVILHPRSAQQGFSGSADWSLIETLKKILHIPVIGNGDIRNAEDALRMVDMTGCDGVMLGRGTLGNPWIFRDISFCFGGQRVFPSPSLSEREMILKRHLNMEIDYIGEGLGLKTFRKHLMWYTKGLRGGFQFRQMANSLHKKACPGAGRELLLNELQRFFLSLSENVAG
ncbi:MAG: tRNA dihydrouridine synthase DusB [Syntrophales bacterium]|nr:tRNA dihydrouridine synthase DusB [Syntrophales bacterium]